MAFDHMSVAEAEAEHAQYVKQLETNIDTTNATREAKCKLVDGVPVAAKLALLCNLIRTTHRTIKFAVGPRPKTEWVEDTSVICEVWAYFPGDQCCPVRLGWGDYSINTSNNKKYSGNNKKYCVYSRHIKNEKYCDRKSQYHIVLTDSIDRAVKNFKKYLRPYTPGEIALMSIREFQHKLHIPVQNASSAYTEAYRAVTKHDSFHNEMRLLMLNNHQFNNSAFESLVKDMLEKFDEQRTKQYETHHGYYVQVREYLGEQVFDVIAVLDVKNTKGRSVEPHRTYRGEELAELDENLPSRLATLSMLNNGTFVEGLGHKVSETSYWVLK